MTAMIRFDNGLLVTAEASFSLNIEKDTGNVELLGTKAGLTLSPFVLHTECNDMLADTVIRANIGEGDFFRAEMENFVNAIEGSRPARLPPRTESSSCAFSTRSTNPPRPASPSIS